MADQKTVDARTHKPGGILGLDRAAVEYRHARGTLAQDVILNAADGGAGLEFAGIGANLMPTPEGLTLSAVGAGDPAERAGLRAGDRILAIDAETTDGMSLADALQRLRGEAGTSVGVSVHRPKTGETVDVTIERAAIVR